MSGGWPWDGYFIESRLSGCERRPERGAMAVDHWAVSKECCRLSPLWSPRIVQLRCWSAPASDSLGFSNAGFLSVGITDLKMEVLVKFPCSCSTVQAFDPSCTYLCWGCFNLFTHWSAEGHVDWSCILALVNIAAAHIRVQVSCYYAVLFHVDTQCEQAVSEYRLFLVF